MDDQKIKYRIAIASSDGIVINQHFGTASSFQIYDLQSNHAIHLVETRDVIPVCQCGNHDDIKMLENIRCLLDCKYVLVSRIGQIAAVLMEQEGVIAMELPGIIEDSVQKLLVYEEIQNLLA